MENIQRNNFQNLFLQYQVHKYIFENAIKLNNITELQSIVRDSVYILVFYAN